MHQLVDLSQSPQVVKVIMHQLRLLRQDHQKGHRQLVLASLLLQIILLLLKLELVLLMHLFRQIIHLLVNSVIQERQKGRLQLVFTE